MVIDIKITGIATTAAFLAAADIKVQQAADAAIKEAGFFIEGEVKQSISGHRAEPRSVDTGRFLNSVKNTKEKKFVAKVATNVPYANILEYGSSKRQPRRHFSNTAKRNEKKVQEFINSKIKSII